jgi:putative sigma-54 modulation protein
METSDAIRSRVETQLSHLQKFLLKPTDVHVILTVEKFRHKAEIVLKEQNLTAQATDISDDLYTSIDRAIAKLETQLKKHKEKVQEHHKHHASLHEVSLQAENTYRTDNENT